MEKVRFGIVGIGNQGSHYNLRFFDEGKVKNGIVTAMCDINPAKIEAMKKATKNKDAVYFEDYRKMLDSGLCDAVLVDVPHYLHCEIVRECIEREINVLCDKPAGVFSSEVRKTNEFAKGKKALFGMMFNQRTNHMYRKIKDMISGGELGKIQRIVWVITDWFRSQAYYNSGSWRATWGGEGGGVLINQCPHQLDLLQWVVGEMPKKVSAFCHLGKWHDIEVEDDVTAYLEYESGATGVFITTTGEYPGCNRLEISGSLGKIICEGGKLIFRKNKEDTIDFTKNTDITFGGPGYDEIEIPTEGNGPQHEGVLNNFANAVLGKEKLFVEGTDGINGVILMNAIELSGWLGGKSVELPIDENLYEKLLKEHIENSKINKSGTDIISDTSGTF